MASNPLTVSSTTEIPETLDDLKRIKGIGQGVETRLNQAGILSFAQLAALSPKQISGILADMIGMSPQKIEEQDWIGQAKQFSAEVEADEVVKIPASSTDQQRYETFSVKLLVDEGNQVRRTNIVHVQRGTEENWAGWDETRLIAFVVKNATLNLVTARTTLQMSVESIPAGAANIAMPTTRVMQFPIDTLNVYATGSGEIPSIFTVDQNCSIQLEWALSNITLLSGDWQVNVYLQALGSGREYTLPGRRLPIKPNQNVYSMEVPIKVGEIEAGAYSMIVTITSEHALELQPGKAVPVYLTGFAEKSMLQFYEQG